LTVLTRVLAGGFTTSAAATFTYMYQDAAEEWGHRGAILQGGFNWVGIGIVQNAGGAQYPDYYTDDFGAIEGNYTPPATADANPPVVGEVGYANGTATVTGVVDSPLNVNDKGATPLTAGITDVVFYTNNITKTGEAFTPEEFNTVGGPEDRGGRTPIRERPLADLRSRQVAELPAAAMPRGLSSPPKATGSRRSRWARRPTPASS
jgi:hypothetical protein